MPNLSRDDISSSSFGATDIKMSCWEYFDFIDQLLDDRLTAAGLMKFKRLHLDMSVNALAIPVAMFPAAWLCNRWLAGFVNRGMASSRYNYVGMSIFYPIFLYYGYRISVNRKLFTDLICDQGQDGTYIRQTLRDKKPGLWKKLSVQLLSNKFSFPEMNEYKGTQFPTNFVSAKVF